MTESPYAPEPQQPGPPANPYAGPQAPAPGQNPYGPPAGGQPYAAAPGGPGYGAVPPAPPKKSNVGKIILIVVGALVLLLIAGGAVFYFAVGKDYLAADKIRVIAPDTLNKRPKSTEPDLQKTAQEAETEIKAAAPNASSAVGAFYGTAEKEDLALLVAVSSLNVSPSTILDATISGVNSTLPLTDLHDVDAGPLGGVAKCGNAEASTIKIGVCVWADKGSAGQFYSYFSSADAAAKELASVRDAVEQRS